MHKVKEERREFNPRELLEAEEHISLCEALDRVLNKGVVVNGDIMISVADVDLIYLGLRVVLTSVETALLAAIIPPRTTVTDRI